MIPSTALHWLSHRLQNIIMRLHADEYLLAQHVQQRVLAKEDTDFPDQNRHKASLRELSVLLRIYFDAVFFLEEGAERSKVEQWLMETQAHTSTFDGEVSEFIETVRKEVEEKYQLTLLSKSSQSHGQSE